MNATFAIANIKDLLRDLDALRDQLGMASTTISRQWDKLGQLGAQRDDHAADLLANLQPHLQGIATFATDCKTQITNMQKQQSADEIERAAKLAALKARNANNPALAALRHHVTGAIERGEKQAIVEIPAPHKRKCTCLDCEQQKIDNTRQAAPLFGELVQDQPRLF